MAARKGPKKVNKKVNKYSNELKRTAVRLSNAAGVRVKDVAEALDIHPFMLSRWRKEARKGLLVDRPEEKAKPSSTAVAVGRSTRSLASNWA